MSYIYIYTQYLQRLTTKSFQNFSLSNISKFNLNQNTNSNHNFKTNQIRKKEKKKKKKGKADPSEPRRGGGRADDRNA